MQPPILIYLALPRLCNQRLPDAPQHPPPSTLLLAPTVALVTYPTSSINSPLAIHRHLQRAAPAQTSNSASLQAGGQTERAGWGASYSDGTLECILFIPWHSLRSSRRSNTSGFDEAMAHGPSSRSRPDNTDKLKLTRILLSGLTLRRTYTSRAHLTTGLRA